MRCSRSSSTPRKSDDYAEQWNETMTPTKNELTTRTLGAPQGWNVNARGPCIGLPVAFDPDDQAFYSYWTATWRERLAILFGRPVRLCVASMAHPPVHLDTEHR